MAERERGGSLSDRVNIDGYVKSEGVSECKHWSAYVIANVCLSTGTSWTLFMEHCTGALYYQLCVCVCVCVCVPDDDGGGDDGDDGRYSDSQTMTSYDVMAAMM